MMRVVFWGTPEFAVHSLKALLKMQTERKCLVVAVVSQPDRPVGRGHQRQPTPVKVLAQSAGIPVLQPTTLKKNTEEGDAFLQTLLLLQPDFCVVTAYGRMIPKRMLDAVPRGFMNVHGSLLPRWRGAAPIQRAIEAGDKETGITLMHLVPEMDAGDMYVQEIIPIHDVDNTQSIFERMGILSEDMLQRYMPAIMHGEMTATPQEPHLVTFAPMLEKKEAWVDWTLSSENIINRSRACFPWPGTQSAWALQNPTQDASPIISKLFDLKRGDTADTAFYQGERRAGTVCIQGKRMWVYTGDGVIEVGSLQWPGKKNMPVYEALQGKNIHSGVCMFTPSQDGDAS